MILSTDFIVKQWIPELSPLLTTCETGPDRRSTGVRLLESSNVIEAPH